MPEESKIILHPQGLEGWTIVRVGHKQGDLFLKLVATDTAEHAFARLVAAHVGNRKSVCFDGDISPALLFAAGLLEESDLNDYLWHLVLEADWTMLGRVARQLEQQRIMEDDS
jgi:hypothetical protein